jgi:hypothetical protein
MIRILSSHLRDPCSSSGDEMFCTFVHFLFIECMIFIESSNTMVFSTTQDQKFDNSQAMIDQRFVIRQISTLFIFVASTQYQNWFPPFYSNEQMKKPTKRSSQVYLYHIIWKPKVVSITWQLNTSYSQERTCQLSL